METGLRAERPARVVLGTLRSAVIEYDKPVSRYPSMSVSGE
jgi:hypothetical protein